MEEDERDFSVFSNQLSQAKRKNSCYKSCGKEEIMEAAIKEKEETTLKEEKKGKRKWLGRVLNFLMYGGWLLILIVGMGIWILISVLSK